MYLTLADVTSRSTFLAGGRNDWLPSEVSFWANLALHEVQRQVWHSPLEALAISSTTSGENRIDLPTDFDYPIGVSSLSAWGPWGSRQLTLKTGDWIDSQSTIAGVPEVYALFSTWMELWPSPNSSYSIQMRYGAKQPTLIDSSSTPILDERWHPGWLYKTAELLEASRGNPQGEAVNRNRYLNFMSSIPTDRAMRQQAKQGMNVSFPNQWNWR